MVRCDVAQQVTPLCILCKSTSDYVGVAAMYVCALPAVHPCLAMHATVVSLWSHSFAACARDHDTCHHSRAAAGVASVCAQFEEFKDKYIDVLLVRAASSKHVTPRRAARRRTLQT